MINCGEEYCKKVREQNRINPKEVISEILALLENQKYLYYDVPQKTRYEHLDFEQEILTKMNSLTQ